MSALSPSVSARLLVQVVVTLVQFHYPRLRNLHRAVERNQQALGAELERPEWARLVSAYRVYARELLELVTDTDELVLDRVQIFAARERLALGALSDRRDTFEALLEKREQLGVVRRRLEQELERTTSLNAESNAAAALRLGIKLFLTASLETAAFEDDALAPALLPFIVETPEAIDWPLAPSPDC